MYHNPVLLNESIKALSIKPDGIYADLTFGGGGHSREILRNLKNGKLIGFDQDEDAIANAINDERFILINQNFRYMSNFLKINNAYPVDGIFADLGVSSHQIDVPERGFSSRFDSELDSRMNRNKEKNAKKVINTYSREKLVKIFSEYGEIQNSKKLAFAITEKRKEQTITTTKELINAIRPCIIREKENKYLAQVFQAIRIEVNDELQALKDMLKQTSKALKPGGRLVIISYHSLEDRIVKNFFKSGNFEGKIEKDFYGNPLVDFKIINKKPIVPSEEEIKNNSRAKSAKLRIAEKL